MDVNMTEQDQVELLKSWAKQYGKIAILTVLLAVGGNFGWNYYKSKQIHYSEHASILYEQMQLNMVEDNIPEFKARANYILENYKRTPYAGLANLALARQALKDKKLDEAKEKLQIVIDKDKDIALRQIARIRKARILLSQKSFDDALKILSKVDDEAYKTLIEEVRGDIYSTKGDTKSARNAYKLALDAAASQGAANRSILRMKYDQLAIDDSNALI